MRWYRQGSYRDALDYFNRPDDRRRADVTDGGNTLIIYRVRQRKDNANGLESQTLTRLSGATRGQGDVLL